MEEVWNRLIALRSKKSSKFGNVCLVDGYYLDDIERHFIERLFSPPNALRLERRIIRVVDGVIMHARWEMTGAKDEQGQDRPMRKGLLNFVMTKQGDTWFITVMHNTELK